MKQNEFCYFSNWKECTARRIRPDENVMNWRLTYSLRDVRTLLAGKENRPAENYEPLLSAFLNLSKVITEAQLPNFFPYGIQDLTRVLCSSRSVKTPSNLEVLSPSQWHHHQWFLIDQRLLLKWLRGIFQRCDFAGTPRTREISIGDKLKITYI